MIQKNFLSLTINFVILSFLLTINLSNGQETEACIDPEMQQFYLSNKNFWQRFDGYDYDNLYLMKYVYRWGIFYGRSQFSLGNYDKKIDFKRDFHFRLKDTKAYTNPYFYSCNTNYGIAVVLGDYTNDNYMIYSLEEKFLVQDLEKSLVIIFRFKAQKITIVNCLKTACDLNNLYSPNPKNIINYDYKYISEKGDLDMNIVYSASQHSITIYNGDYHYGYKILTYEDAYLMDNLKKYQGKGYLGITATSYDCDYYNNLIYSYICVNGGAKMTPTVLLSGEGKTISQNEIIKIPPNKLLTLTVEYKDSKEKSLMGEGELYIDSQKYQIPPSDLDNGYIFKFYSKSLSPSKYDIYYTTDHDTFKFSVNVQNVEIKQLNFTYGQYEGEEKSFEIENGKRILKYGTLNGDFDLYLFNEDNQYLYFYITPEDDSHNPIEIVDIDKTKEDLMRNSDNVITLEKVEDKEFIYKVGIKITKKGKYSIINLLDMEINFNVRDLVPSKEKTICRLKEYPPKIYDRDEEVQFSCEFKDKDNDNINIIDAQNFKNIKIETYLYRNEKILSKIEGICSDNNCIYSFTSEYNGKYQFETKIINNDSEEFVETSKNVFYVSPEPTTINECLIFHFDIEKWIKIEDTTSTIFNFDEENENSDNLFLIDLVDVKDKEKNHTPYSEIYEPFANFDPNKIKGLILEDHSGFNKEITFEEYEYKSKKYILAKLPNSKDKMRRSTLKYTMLIDFGGKRNLILNYILDIGKYEACAKALDIKSSIIEPTKLDSIIAGQSEKVAELILKTDLEHLYNYFLTDEEEKQITFIEEKNNCIQNGKCKVEFSKSNIKGVYNLYFMSQEARDYKIIGKIGNDDLKIDENYFSVKIEPINEAYSLEKIEPDKYDYSVEDDIILEFKIKDRFGNIINYDLSDNFGLRATIKIKNIETSSNIKFEKGDGKYYIKETNRKSGNYNLKLEIKNSNIEYNYNKVPAKASNFNSKIRVLNSKKLNLKEESTAELYLQDEYGNEINSGTNEFERDIKNVEIFAINGNGLRIEYSKSEGSKFISEKIQQIGTYYLYGNVYGNQIGTCTSCVFDVVYDGYVFAKSLLKMIGEKIIIMKQENVYTLYEGFQRPAFEFDFMTEDGLPSNEIPQQTEITASIKSDEETAYTELNKVWIDINKLVWTLKDNYSLQKDKEYTLVVANENTQYKYYLLIKDYGDDKSDEAYDISKTFVSPNILYLKAGISDSFIVEFRNRKNLRYNQPLELSKFKYEEVTGLEINPKLGNKNGQIIVEIKSEKVINYLPEVKVKMTYNNQNIDTEVQVIVSSGDLAKFEIDKNSLIDPDEYNLNPGIAGSSNKIKLIAKDKYDNQITDTIFDTKLYSEESFSYLFNLKHNLGYKTSITSTANPVYHTIELSLSSDKIGELTLSSLYLDYDYKMKISAGVPSKYSKGYLNHEPGKTKAGETRIFIIEPYDVNGNRITDEEVIEKVKNNYKVKIFDLDGNLIVDGITPKKIDAGSIEYEIENKKAQTKVVEAYYNDEKIIINNNIINVVSGDANIDNSKLIYNGNEYSVDNKIDISLASLPIIDLVLYDDYENKVEASNDFEFDFILEDNIISQQIIYNKNLRLNIEDSKVNDYFNIDKDENKYHLKVKIGENEKQIEINFIDVSPNEDKESPVSFILNKDTLVQKAGEEGTVSVSFYTEKGKPMGYFFDKTSEIEVDCGEENTIKPLILQGNYYGTYDIIISSEVAYENIICSVNAINKIKSFKVKILPNKAEKCKLVSDSSILKKAIAGEIFSLKFECSDFYGNKAYLDSEQFGAWITNPKEEIVEYYITSNSYYSLSLNVEPTIKGEYTIKSMYLEEEYIKFTALSGAISPDNSYLKVDDNAVAGTKLNVEIHALDKYNNPVDLTEEDKSKFILYHRYQDNSKYNDYDQILNNDAKILDNIIKYEYQVTKAGVNEFRGIYPTTSTIIRCENCEVKVDSDKFDLNNSEVHKYNSFSKLYEILENNDALYNYEEDLLVRVYPKDQWGNTVKGKDLDIKVLIDEKELEKVDSNDEFLEFKEDKIDFSKLSGEKKLIIKYGEERIEFIVNIIGKNDFDDDVDPTKTKLLEQNLEFTAGKYGYFILELRNKYNARCKITENINIEINPSDSLIKTQIFNQKSSIIFVLVNSTKSNTFPNKGKLILDVKINTNEPVLELDLFVKPGDLTSAKINEADNDNKLTEISIDEELRFSLIGKDTYGNDALINVDEAKLIVKNVNEITYKSNYVDLSSGKLYYIYGLTISGEYKIESNLFIKNYTLTVNTGEICPENTKAIIETPIKAGSISSLIILAKDKYNNDVKINQIIVDKFLVFMLSNKYDIIEPKATYSDSSLNYKEEIDIIGTYQYIINYNGRKIKCEKLVVNPSECDPEQTLIYSKDKNGKYIIFDKDDTNNYIYSSYSSPLNLRLEFRDKYSNIISDITGIKVENANLHENNMTPLDWSYKNGELYLDLTITSNKKTLEHLVTRTGTKAYIFSFTVTSENSKQFDLKVNHFGKNEDEEKYGNGDYILEKCEISSDRAQFIAGSNYEIFLTLRTSEGYIYNGDFDTSFINCDTINDVDESFKCDTLKKETGIYIIKYYTSKYRTEGDQIYNTIILKNSDETKTREFRVLLINKGGIPNKEFTEIITSLPSKIKADEDKPFLLFVLKDKYSNPIEPDDIINKLHFENHDSIIKANIEGEPNSYYIKAQLEITYPPKDISIQLYYVDQNINLDLFKEPQTSVFEFSIDYGKTVITSKNYNRMKAGELLELNIYTYDKYSQYFEDEDVSASFTASVVGPLGKNPEKRTYYFRRDNDYKYIYRLIIDESTYYTVTGTYSIVVSANEKSIASYTQTVFSGDIDPSKFEVYYIHMDQKAYDDQNIPAGEYIQFMVQAYDKFENKIDNAPLIPESFIIVNNEGEEYQVTKYNGGSGALECLFTSTLAGKFKFNYFYEGKKINPDIEKGPDEIIFVAGECSAINPNIDYPEEEEIDVSVTYKYTIKCFDQYNNEVTKGGAKFTSKVSLYVEESQSKIDIEPKIEDIGTGQYAISFIPPLAGGYSIYTYLDGDKYGEKQFNLTARECTNYMCPNGGRCVDDLRECIPEKNRCMDEEKKEKYPFRCDESSECVDSMTKCVPEDAKQCPYMNASYPEGKSYLCSYYLPLDCKRKYPNYKQLCPDGICRKSQSLKPNQRVCPIGKILCADLTCKDNINECYNDWEECSDTQIRCPDQSCVDDQKNCPTTITCSKSTDFVCPDGTCVENEIYCSKLKTCPDETPYLCTDNSCANKPENCPHSVACGHGKSLCSDLICRTEC